MYLLDTNIIRAFEQGHPTLKQHLQRVAFHELALPCIVAAEILRGRCDYVLKSTPEQSVFAQAQLLKSRRLLDQFGWVALDTHASNLFAQMLQKYRSRKRYADLMIAATVLSGSHILITRNTKDFIDILPAHQLANWIDM